MFLNASVGKTPRARNYRQDVTTVRGRLNDIGISVSDLVTSIKIFQTIIKGYVDGIVDVKMTSHKWLAAENCPRVIKIPRYNSDNRYIVDWCYNKIMDIIRCCKTRTDDNSFDSKVRIYTNIKSQSRISLSDILKIYVCLPISTLSETTIKNLFMNHGFTVSAWRLFSTQYICITNHTPPSRQEGRIQAPTSELPPQQEGSSNQESSNASTAPSPQNNSSEIPQWVRVARNELGVREISGDSHNRRIIEYHSTTGRFQTDEIPWCASFCTWVLQNSSCSTSGCTAAARSFSTASAVTRLSKPYFGCIIVFKYGSGAQWSGHVGILEEIVNQRFKVLGGNQSDSVKYSYFGRTKLYGYYWPINKPLTYELVNNQSSANTQEASYSSTR